QHRRRIHNDSLLVLQRQYRIDDRPSWETRQQLAERLGMTNREIQVWFQNRRAKERR
ncbi:homeobox domain-containing protein, partial [Entophlyctis helioformis]